MIDKTMKTVLGITIVLAIVLIGLGVTNLSDNVVSENNEMVIGVNICLTGICANVGEMSQMGIDIAVDEINAKGGINGKKLRVVYEDVADGDPKVAITNVNSLSARGIDFVIGPTWTPDGLASAPVACTNKMLMVSPSLGAAEFAEECDYIFNVWMPDEDLSRELGKKIYEDGYKTLGVLSSQQNWELIQGDAVIEGFEGAGGEVLFSEFPLWEQKDFRTEILKIKESGAEAIYVQYGRIDIIAKQLKEAGLDISIYAALIDSERVNNAGSSLNGAVIINQVIPSEGFKAKFKKEYGLESDYGADTAYDALKILAKAIEESGSEDSRIVSEFIRENIQEYRGESGFMEFNEDGNVAKDFNFLEVVSGKLEIQ